MFKADHVTINACELWNRLLSEHRKKPILDLLEFICLKIMKRLIRRKKKAVSWDAVPPRVCAKIAKAVRKLIIIKASISEFKVIDYVIEIKRHYVINLKHAYCEYGGWQLNEIPCKHALAFILHGHSDLAAYIDRFLIEDVYLQTGQNLICLNCLFLCKWLKLGDQKSIKS